MTATEELRRLLDERGVEWRHHGEKRRTWFDVNEIAWFAIETPAGYLIINSSPLTPEQAIDATLGSCNCLNSERTGTWSDFDMQMAYHMGYDDALARRKPDAGKVVTNG